MSSEKKRNFHFNVIDLVIVIVIIGCIVGILLRKETKNTLETTSNEDIYIAVSIPCVRNESVGEINVDDTLYYQDTDSEIGSVKYVTSRPTIQVREKDNGSQFMYTNPARTDIYCILKVSGTDTTNGYFVGGKTYVGVGLSTNFHTDHFALTYCVVNMSTDYNELKDYVDKLATKTPADYNP